MTVEAAILLPGVMLLVLFMISLVQLASAEAALRSAVNETGKSMASYWLPVRMVYSDAKTRVSGTQAGGWTQEAWSRLEDLRNRWSGTEDWIMQYERLLPEPAVRILQWETEKRRWLEESAGQAGMQEVHRITDPLLCAAFEPVLKHYANGRLLDKDSLHVDSVRLPSLERGGEAYLEITARYEWKLPVPFLNRKLVLKKKTYERAWVGADE